MVAVLFIPAAVLFLVADRSREDPITRELRKFQGTWELVRLEVDGKTFLDSEAARGITATFRGNRLTIKWPDVVQQGTFTLDPTKRPKHFDVEFKGRGRCRGIYDLGREGLNVGYRAEEDGKRPTGFGTRTGTIRPSVLLALKRKSK
jgi:uncharacterized protein (TIGR03067 family)